MIDKESDENVVIIEPKGAFFDLHLKELFRSKELVSVLVRRDFVTVYKQTILGPLWFIIQPLLTTIMYVFVFGGIARMGTDGIPQPLFYFAGTMLWTFFSTCLQKTSDTFVNNAALFGKIYFPRLAIPLSYVTTNLITLGIQFGVLVVLAAFYIIKGTVLQWSAWFFAFPLVILQVGMLGVGIGLIISALTTKYRDLRNLVTFGMTLWMYITPVVYPLSQVPGRFKSLYAVNIMAPVMEFFRFALLGKGTPPGWQLLVSIGMTILLFLAGIIVFNRNERTFVDVI